MDLGNIRASSSALARKYGFQVPQSLPLLDANLKLEPKPTEEIFDRALVASVVVAVSYGFSRGHAWSWLAQESLTKNLSWQEEAFLNGADENRRQFQTQVETLCAFAWALEFLPDLDYSKDCPNHLVSLYPDFRAMESSSRFRGKAKLRPVQQIVEACDAVYCLHWGLRQTMLDGIKPKRQLSLIVVTERRRALDWILSRKEWDNISLDT